MFVVATRVSLVLRTLSRMKIIVNKKEVEVAEGTDLATFLSSQGADGPGYAVAIGGKVVPRTARAGVVLAEGDVLTLIKAVCGG